MIVATLHFLSPAILLALSSPPLPAQDSGDGGADGASPLVADSVELLDRARSAQRRFEYARRANMPMAHGGGSGPCDDVVGRMCWRHGPGSLWAPEPEAEAVLEARTALLGELEEVGSRIRSDEWVLGQRVWYLLEARRPTEAADLARTCGGGTAWWCAALEGLSLHVGGRYAEAESAFGRALAGMEPARRLEWEDVRDLLDGDARGVIRDEASRSMGEGGEVVRRMWRLSDPLHLIDGNDRWTEHLARHTVARIRSDSENPYGISWGDDLTELLVRYGWEVGWERAMQFPGTLDRSSHVLGHEHPDARTYVVSGRVLVDPATAPSRAWEPSRMFRPSAYAPAYAPVILPMGTEVVVLTRGDRALVGAPFVLPEDTTYRERRELREPHVIPQPLEDASIMAGVFLPDVRGKIVRESRVEGRPDGVLVVDVPAGSYWISVEVLDPARGLAGRLREGLRIDTIPPEVATLSPLLLLEPGPEPTDAREALSRLDLDGAVPAGAALLVGWEIWGLGWREEVLAYRLTVEESGGGFLRRAGEFLGLGGRERPVSLSWNEPGPARPGPMFRSVSMDLPNVETGVYDIRLEVVSPGRTTLVGRREVRVVEGG